MQDYLYDLNTGTAGDRLAALQKLMAEPQPQTLPQYSNNHIHTFYSFSPYSPTAAVYQARQAGLPTAGIMDHDSLAGAEEFVRAGELAGIATTVGIECRVHTAGTPLEGRTVNNPDQISNTYMALHGVPRQSIQTIQDFFAPLRENRNVRNRKMLAKLNDYTGIMLDFDRDVLPISKYGEGGVVTERHLLYALAGKIASETGQGKPLADFVRTKLRLTLTATQAGQLEDAGNPFYLYDLLGIFKSSLVEKIYVDATDECVHIFELKKLAESTGALLCYPYLGDIETSVTGDKKAQQFEDRYLDTLFEFLAEIKVDGLAYMPSRNTPAQLDRLQRMCAMYGFFEISGEDINTPRQKFICSQLAQPEFAHLTDAAWELIRYERAASSGTAEKPKREK